MSIDSVTRGSTISIRKMKLRPKPFPLQTEPPTGRWLIIASQNRSTMYSFCLIIPMSCERYLLSAMAPCHRTWYMSKECGFSNHLKRRGRGFLISLTDSMASTRSRLKAVVDAQLLHDVRQPSRTRSSKRAAIEEDTGAPSKRVRGRSASENPDGHRDSAQPCSKTATLDSICIVGAQALIKDEKAGWSLKISRDSKTVIQHHG